MSDKDFQELYSRGQEHVERYVRTNRAWRRVEQRQRVLLHMMNNDSEFLLSSKISFFFLSFNEVLSFCFRLFDNEKCNATES